MSRFLLRFYHHVKEAFSRKDNQLVAPRPHFLVKPGFNRLKIAAGKNM